MSGVTPIDACISVQKPRHCGDVTLSRRVVERRHLLRCDAIDIEPSIEQCLSHVEVTGIVRGGVVQRVVTAIVQVVTRTGAYQVANNVEVPFFHGE